MFYHRKRHTADPAGRLRLTLALASLLLVIFLISGAPPSSAAPAGSEPSPQNGTFFDKLRNSLRPATTEPPRATSLQPNSNSNSPPAGELEDAPEPEEPAQADEAEDEDELDEDDDDLEEEDDEPAEQTAVAELAKRPPEAAKVYDLLGNQIKIEGNRTVIVLQNKARDLGLLTIKAILLGPLIGLTLKAALIRGLLWAVGAYFMHLFFPSLLSTLGLGTGLVGFARSGQPPDYSQMLLRAALNLLETRP